MKAQDGVDVDFHKTLAEGMLPIIETTMASVRLKLNKNDRKFCFEIYGYDFLIDKNLAPWLIEINTNPCLEESNQLLRSLLPRMLDDAFKLTLDQLFPPLPSAKLEQYGAESPPRGTGQQFAVPGYKDDENMWGAQPFYTLRTMDPRDRV